MSLNAAEAHRMLAASEQHPTLVAQTVPSPYGLRGHEVMKELIEGGFVGELRSVQVYSMSAALADADSPLSWRQDAALSGYNMLNLGILHETLMRWVPAPIRVLAQVHAFIPTRIDPESGVKRAVGTPDSVQVLAVLENGARAVYDLSAVTSYGHSMGIRLDGTEGVLQYDLAADRIWGASRTRKAPANTTALEEIPIPDDKARAWRVEADFIDAIQTSSPITLTDFATGVQYMEFTEAVARSAQLGEAVELPLEEFVKEPA
jgi:predicted dehydrogenase